MNAHMPLGNLGGKADCESSPGKRQESRTENQAKDIVKEALKHRLPDFDKADNFYGPCALFTSGLHLQHQE